MRPLAIDERPLRLWINRVVAVAGAVARPAGFAHSWS